MRKETEKDRIWKASYWNVHECSRRNREEYAKPRIWNLADCLPTWDGTIVSSMSGRWMEKKWEWYWLFIQIFAYICSFKPAASPPYTPTLPYFNPHYLSLGFHSKLNSLPSPLGVRVTDLWKGRSDLVTLWSHFLDGSHYFGENRNKSPNSSHAIQGPTLLFLPQLRQFPTTHSALFLHHRVTHLLLSF